MQFVHKLDQNRYESYAKDHICAPHCQATLQCQGNLEGFFGGGSRGHQHLSVAVALKVPTIRSGLTRHSGLSGLEQCVFRALQAPPVHAVDGRCAWSVTWARPQHEAPCVEALDVRCCGSGPH